MTKREQLLASLSRMATLVETAAAQASADANLISICSECISIEAAGVLIYNAAVDISHEHQGINEKLEDPIGKRAMYLFNLVADMRPATPEGREACAHVALGFAIRENGGVIETIGLGDSIAWRLVEEMAGRSA